MIKPKLASSGRSGLSKEATVGCILNVCLKNNEAPSPTGTQFIPASIDPHEQFDLSQLRMIERKCLKNFFPILAQIRFTDVYLSMLLKKVL